MLSGIVVIVGYFRWWGRQVNPYKVSQGSIEVYLYIIMEKLSGGSIAQMLSSFGPLPEQVSGGCNGG